MTVALHRCVRLCVVLALPGTIAGCVNNYVVDDSRGASDGPTSGAGDGDGDGDGDGGGRTADGAATKGDGAGGDGTGGDPPSTTGDGDASTAEASATGAGSTGGTPVETCQPCTADAECGRDVDLCVDVTEVQTACLRACGEACPRGFSCLQRVSVQGVSGMVCSPDAGACPS